MSGISTRKVKGRPHSKSNESKYSNFVSSRLFWWKSLKIYTILELSYTRPEKAHLPAKNGNNDIAYSVFPEMFTERMKIQDEEGNRWHPFLQPKPPAQFGHMKYCFEAPVNRTWATDGIFKLPFLSSTNWHFCDFNKRAINHPLTVNYSVA